MIKEVWSTGFWGSCFELKGGVMRFELILFQIQNSDDAWNVLICRPKKEESDAANAGKSEAAPSKKSKKSPAKKPAAKKEKAAPKSPSKKESKSATKKATPKRKSKGSADEKPAKKSKASSDAPKHGKEQVGLQSHSQLLQQTLNSRSCLTSLCRVGAISMHNVLHSSLSFY